MFWAHWSTKCLVLLNVSSWAGTMRVDVGLQISLVVKPVRQEQDNTHSAHLVHCTNQLGLSHWFSSHVSIKVGNFFQRKNCSLRCSWKRDNFNPPPFLLSFAGRLHNFYSLYLTWSHCKLKQLYCSLQIHPNNKSSMGPAVSHRLLVLSNTSLSLIRWACNDTSLKISTLLQPTLPLAHCTINLLCDLNSWLYMLWV